MVHKSDSNHEKRVANCDCSENKHGCYYCCHCCHYCLVGGGGGGGGSDGRGGGVGVGGGGAGDDVGFLLCLFMVAVC